MDDHTHAFLATLERARERVFEYDDIAKDMQWQNSELPKMLGRLIQEFSEQSSELISILRASAESKRQAMDCLAEFSSTCNQLASLVCDIWPNGEDWALRLKKTYVKNMRQFEELSEQAVLALFPVP